MENEQMKSLFSAATLRPAKMATHTVNPAEWMHERVVRSINDFEAQLDQEHEVGARLVSAGPELTFHIDDVGYWGPDMVIFYGIHRNNQRVELLQHISQLSVALVAVEKLGEKARRIGFGLVERLQKEKD